MSSLAKSKQAPPNIRHARGQIKYPLQIKERQEEYLRTHNLEQTIYPGSVPSVASNSPNDMNKQGVLSSQPQTIPNLYSSVGNHHSQSSMSGMNHGSSSTLVQPPQGQIPGRNHSQAANIQAFYGGRSNANANYGIARSMGMTVATSGNAHYSAPITNNIMYASQNPFSCQVTPSPMIIPSISPMTYSQNQYTPSQYASQQVVYRGNCPTPYYNPSGTMYYPSVNMNVPRSNISNMGGSNAAASLPPKREKKIIKISDEAGRDLTQEILSTAKNDTLSSSNASSQANSNVLPAPCISTTSTSSIPETSMTSEIDALEEQREVAQKSEENRRVDREAENSVNVNEVIESCRPDTLLKYNYAGGYYPSVKVTAAKCNISNTSGSNAAASICQERKKKKMKYKKKFAISDPDQMRDITQEICSTSKNDTLSSSNAFSEATSNVLSAPCLSTTSTSSIPETSMTSEIAALEERREVAQKSEENRRVNREAESSEIVDSYIRDLLLKYNYAEDQWSPINLEGKKKYDRAFLLNMRSEPFCLHKPKYILSLEKNNLMPHQHENPKAIDKIHRKEVRKARGLKQKTLTKCPLEDTFVISSEMWQANAERLQYLENRIQKIEEAHSCSICMECRRNVAFLCGHGACANCAQTLKSCHLCHEPITKKINLFC